MQDFVIMMTKAAGPLMVATQAVLCLGNLYLRNFPSALYWGGGVMLTTGALLMGAKGG